MTEEKYHYNINDKKMFQQEITIIKVKTKAIIKNISRYFDFNA